MVSLPFSSLQIATRKAYGQALAKLGHASDRIIALDGDTKNSTFSELFKKEHPDRFIECYIAEQNMVGVGLGFSPAAPLSSCVGSARSLLGPRNCHPALTLGPECRGRGVCESWMGANRGAGWGCRCTWARLCGQAFLGGKEPSSWKGRWIREARTQSQLSPSG